MLKKAAICLFVVCIVLQSGLVAIYTISKIRYHRAYVKSILKRELKSGKFDAELVVFREQQLKDAEWEHPKEFFLGDDKFDVVRVKDSGGMKIYHCINDKKEKALFRTLDHQEKQNNILDDMVKRLCLSIHAIPTLDLQDNNPLVLHRDYFADRYFFCFSESHFRPPTISL